jgi:lipopolysaccharide transport system permease protein
MRDLISQFTRREIEGRYKGSFLGILWSFITPIVMLLVYTFVFGVVFKARWPHPQGGGSLADFALIMFSGQLAFNLFSEPVSRASGLIVGVPNYVKKVVFPTEILPLVVTGSAAFHCAISTLVLIVASLIVYGSIPWTIILFPFAALPLMMFGLGIAWFLAALGVYIRDIGFIVTVGLQILFFASPVFYPMSSVPAAYHPLLQLNPVTPGIELVRSCILAGHPSNPYTWVIAFVIGFVTLMLGYVWFMGTRKGFSDVL